ncbi:uncharacterized protein LOC130089939 isoform X7 [Rhinichthys klamathensis goyatoka]|uniref:uncharacterized protein LOC130089939 isoform X7 n=1 Tax=Rhinichthys klamathensis goyatoka TaxID=3034132 RepID=UPI0024B4A84A|nr:uncharacterized protein LOC130089939 isoform X7 [Rhinichthys klamathensis goyatoka]
MRRALSKSRHRTTTEAVYEEIHHRPTNRQSFFTQRGSVLSEEQHSGYEDADELLSGPNEEEQQITPENYDDIITVGLRSRDTENYDDVIIVRQFSNDKADCVQEEYDDVKNVREYMSDMFDYDDVGEEPGKQGGTL